MIELTHHCNALVIAGSGLLIFGSSGSGKSSLTFGLIERAKQMGLDAGFTSDDRTIIEVKNQCLVARAPESLSGKIELYGYGIIECAYVPSAEISVVVKLLADEKLERMPDPDFTIINGIQIPELHAPERHEEAAVRIIFAWLKDNCNKSISLAL